jgi:hypothetical protein
MSAPARFGGRAADCVLPPLVGSVYHMGGLLTGPRPRRIDQLNGFANDALTASRTSVVTDGHSGPPKRVPSARKLLCGLLESSYGSEGSTSSLRHQKSIVIRAGGRLETADIRGPDWENAVLRGNRLAGIRVRIEEVRGSVIRDD